MVEVEIATGRLAGRRRRDVVLFAGIPYAAPATGARRFERPSPATPWAGVRDATAFGPMAWQGPGLLAGLALGSGACDEDCLSLNVITPGTSGRRPVLVWIHGGGFTAGSSATPWYDGTGFALAGDVVVVTINYRLGALGFLHLDELSDRHADSGRLGLLDQIAALRWVRDNISAFGGDPDDVTVFGESAGAMSIGCLLAMPEASGLFRRAITQSGAAEAVATPDDAAAVTRALCDLVDARTVDDLLAVAPEALVAAQQQLAEHSRRQGTAGDSVFALPFRPVVDGTVLPDPLAAIGAGSAADVDLISGTNADECTIFLLAVPSDLDEARALRRAERWLPGGEALYRSYAERRPGATPWELLAALMSDAVFRMPSLRLLDAHAGAAGAGVRTHGYRFDWASPAFGGMLRAAHAVEIPFVWDNLAKGGVTMLVGDDPPKQLAAAMHEAWWRFAAGEDPGHDGTGPWPRHDAATHPTMVFDATSGVVDDPDAEDRLAWMAP